LLLFVAIVEVNELVESAVNFTLVNIPFSEEGHSNIFELLSI
jgi:hypothetical protein